MMAFLDNGQKKQQLFLSYGIFVLNGVLALSVGTLLPFIRDARGLNYAFIGLLVSLHSLGNLFAGFTSGLLPLVMGRKRSALIFSSFYSLSFILIAVGEGSWLLLLAFFMTGMARGSTSNFCNRVVNQLAPGKAWVLNGLHAMFAVGAFLLPLLLAGVTHEQPHRWFYVVYFLIVMGLISWCLYVKMPVGEISKEEKQGGKKELGFLKEPLFYLCTATLFFYLCAEQGVIGWLVTYFMDTNLLTASMAQMMPSLLWVMILLGRLSSAWLSTRVSKSKLLVVMGMSMVCFFLLLITSRSMPWIVTGIVGFGFSMAGVYPTTVSFSGKLMEKYHLAWSFIMTIAAFGSILMPAVIGGIAERFGLVYGMASIAIALFMALGFIVALTVYQPKNVRTLL